MHKIFFVILIVPVIVHSQSSLFMPLDIKSAYNKGTRSYDGSPGPNYWQNRSEYNIKASIEPGTRVLSGDETITYHNNSPDTLKELVIRLYQNINRPGAPRDFGIIDEALTDGVLIDELSVNGIPVELDDNKKAEENATNLTLHLDSPVPPNSVTEITASWSFTIPKGQNNRMGTYDSTTFFIAYWYPQISVYDDVHGWDKIVYAGLLEFYNDFSDYDVEISVPPGYFVWSTGVLQNPEQVYSPEVLSRYNLALTSDSVVHIITQVVHPNNEQLITSNYSWHIHAASVPDFAFAVSDSWLWDACSIDLGRNLEQGGLPPCPPSLELGVGQKKFPLNKCLIPSSAGGGTKRGLSENNRTLISAVYNKSSADMYEVAAISRQTIEYYSRVFPAVPYPYPRMTVFNGSGGMEFPMMVNEGSSDERKWTVYVTTHEIAHTYFPFYMGINERKYAWMDEGWAQNLGEKAQKLIAPDLDQQARNVFRFLNYSGNENDVPMMVTTDNVHNGPSYGNTSYFRPCNAYNFLEDALGHELFMKALHEYIARWHGKHPIPYDFFFTFANVASRLVEKGGSSICEERSDVAIPYIKGMDVLDWFFKPWFFEQGYPDLGIGYVESKRGTVKITVEKLGNLPVPVYLTLKTSHGDSLTLSESCSIWKDGRTETTLELKTNKKITSVKLGNQYIPDADTINNVWNVK